MGVVRGLLGGGRVHVYGVAIGRAGGCRRLEGSLDGCERCQCSRDLGGDQLVVDLQLSDRRGLRVLLCRCLHHRGLQLRLIFDNGYVCSVHLLECVCRLMLEGSVLLSEAREFAGVRCQSADDEGFSGLSDLGLEREDLSLEVRRGACFTCTDESFGLAAGWCRSGVIETARVVVAGGGVFARKRPRRGSTVGVLGSGRRAAVIAWSGS